jgi:predicted ester cyclase
MSTEENKAIVRRFVEEGINKVDFAAFDELVAPNVDFDPPPGFPLGREGWKRNRLVFQVGFPDAHWTLEDMIAEGDKVVSRFTMRGTHQGEFFGIPPTGKQVTVTGMAIVRLSGGKIVHQRISNDDLGMMQQLGVIPPMG